MANFPGIIGIIVFPSKDLYCMSEEPEGQEFGNYQEVKGVKFPFLITQSFGPQTIEFMVSEIKINEGVGDADFVE